MKTKFGKHIPSAGELRSWGIDITSVDFPEQPGWGPNMMAYENRKPTGWCSAEGLTKSHGLKRTANDWSRLMHDVAGLHVPSIRESRLNTGNDSIEEQERRVIEEVAERANRVHYGYGLQVRPVLDRDFVRMYCAIKHRYIDVASSFVMRIA